MLELVEPLARWKRKCPRCCPAAGSGGCGAEKSERNDHSEERQMACVATPETAKAGYARFACIPDCGTRQTYQLRPVTDKLRWLQTVAPIIENGTDLLSPAECKDFARPDIQSRRRITRPLVRRAYSIAPAVNGLLVVTNEDRIGQTAALKWRLYPSLALLRDA